MGVYLQSDGGSFSKSFVFKYIIVKNATDDEIDFTITNKSSFWSEFWATVRNSDAVIINFCGTVLPIIIYGATVVSRQGNNDIVTSFCFTR